MLPAYLLVTPLTRFDIKPTDLTQQEQSNSVSSSHPYRRYIHTVLTTSPSGHEVTSEPTNQPTQHPPQLTKNKKTQRTLHETRPRLPPRLLNNQHVLTKRTLRTPRTNHPHQRRRKRPHRHRRQQVRPRGRPRRAPRARLRAVPVVGQRAVLRDVGAAEGECE